MFRQTLSLDFIRSNTNLKSISHSERTEMGEPSLDARYVFFIISAAKSNLLTSRVSVHTNCCTNKMAGVSSPKHGALIGPLFFRPVVLVFVFFCFFVFFLSFLMHLMLKSSSAVDCRAVARKCSHVGQL